MTSLKRKRIVSELTGCINPRQFEELSQSRMPILSRDWRIGKHGGDSATYGSNIRAEKFEKKVSGRVVPKRLFFYRPMVHFCDFPLTHDFLGGKKL